MEREIEFRGKRIDTGKWIVGSETYLRDGDGIWLADKDKDVVKVDPATVGQYTGLNDKNGTEIYEGDIMVIPESNFNAKIIGKVVYSCDSFCIRNRNSGSEWCLSWSLRKHDAEVIGNMYDNTELLNKK